MRKEFQKRYTMTVKKNKYTQVNVRLPNEIVALLRVRHGAQRSLYDVVRDTVVAAAGSNAVDCSFTNEEYTQLDILARNIGFENIAALVRHLSLAYLKLYLRQHGRFATDVEREEIREMFIDCERAEHYEEGISVTTTPRKIRGV